MNSDVDRGRLLKSPVFLMIKNSGDFFCAFSVSMGSTAVGSTKRPVLSMKYKVNYVSVFALIGSPIDELSLFLGNKKAFPEECFFGFIKIESLLQ
jgi:hypothetical protein